MIEIDGNINVLKNLTVLSENGVIVKKSAVHKIVSELKKKFGFTIASLQINFVHADYITIINKKYLNHYYSTDIITFNYSGKNDRLDGEIFISLEDAADNAGKYGVSFENEMLRLLVHGILHLIGYDDKTPDDKAVMKKIENDLVKQHIAILPNKIVEYDS